jgi:hypothetical protein
LSPNDLADAARRATEMVRAGEDPQRILKALPDKHAEAALALARRRKQASERFEDPWSLWFDDAGLRYATPDTVARARAERLAPLGGRVADVACGAGIQLAYLARVFDEAVGIDIDPQRAELARRNAEALGANVEIVVGDALDPQLRKTVGPVDLVFCDPARAPEASTRMFDDLAPDVRRVHEAWSKGARAWCYELPPMMTPERVREAFDAECEYTSLHGELNRLAVYGGEAQRAERSALALPASERLTDSDAVAVVGRTEEVGSVVHLVDRAILSASLMGQLAARLGGAQLLSDEHPRRTLLTGAAGASSAFARTYEVLVVAPWDVDVLRPILEDLDAGKVTLRASIPPAQYWALRNKLEKDLPGDKAMHLFRVGERGIVASAT